MITEHPKQKVFYKMLMGIDENGIAVTTRRYFSIHETPCFHFCIAEHDRGFLVPGLRREGETGLQTARRRKVKVYRIAKAGSRIAFETEEEAFKHLQFLKRKQLNHMRRDIEFVKRFLDVTEDKAHTDLGRDRFGLRILPGTQELVGEYYLFD